MMLVKAWPKIFSPKTETAIEYSPGKRGVYDNKNVPSLNREQKRM
jgi:hypothetical protein